MKKLFQYILVTLQIIVSLLFVSIIVFSFIDTLRFNKDFSPLAVNSISMIIQLVVFLYIAIELCLMNEPIRWDDSPLLHFVLLTLCFDGVITLPYFFETINLYLISPIILGKIHIFSIISSTMFLILCGVNQNETNYKKNNIIILFTLSASLLLTYFIGIKSPTSSQPLNMFVFSSIFRIFFIISTIIAIISFIPSYLTDRTRHNKLKTFSYILFTIALGILRYSINVTIPLVIIALLVLIASSISLIINMKSYSI